MVRTAYGVKTHEDVRRRLWKGVSMDSSLARRDSRSLPSGHRGSVSCGA